MKILITGATGNVEMAVIKSISKTPHTTQILGVIKDNKTGKEKLTAIKIIHTIIWFFFTVVFIYMAYAVMVNKIDKYVWIGIAFFSMEVIVLLIFRNNCPLTIIAHRYSNSTRDNFDIYLPNWLAKNNKVIYSVFAILLLCGIVYRILNF